VAAPFPGMDPYIENQCWEDFHHTLIEGLRAALVPQTRPYYIVRVEEHVYVEHVLPDDTADIRPMSPSWSVQRELTGEPNCDGRDPHACASSSTRTRA